MWAPGIGPVPDEPQDLLVMPRRIEVEVHLDLSPIEAATLHHFIGVHMPVYHGAVTRDSLIDIRRRLLSALKDAGVLA